MIKAWSLLLPNAAFPLLINWSPKKIPWYPNITKSAPNLYQIDPSTSVIIWPLQELATANRPYHKECQVGCQIDCQIKCQKESQKNCQIECQIKCQIEIDDSFHHPRILCHFIGHFTLYTIMCHWLRVIPKECQKNCQIECQIKCQIEYTLVYTCVNINIYIYTYTYTHIDRFADLQGTMVPSTSVIIWPLQELATANRPYHKECQV